MGAMATLHTEKREVSPAASSEERFAVFKVGGGEYAVDIMRIMEIIRPQKVTRIPKAPAFVEGVINLRGKVAPVIDMRGRFGIEESYRNPKKARVIIINAGGRVLGAAVDEVSEVISLKSEDIEKTPDEVRGIGSEFLHGVGKAGDRLIVILDIEKLLTSQEIIELDRAQQEHAREDQGSTEGQ
jgi:purine-binding chemotaxis protein CheW